MTNSSERAQSTVSGLPAGSEGPHSLVGKPQGLEASNLLLAAQVGSVSQDLNQDS